MANKPIAIAIQSQEGQKRVQVSPSAKTEELFTKVQQVFNLTSCQFALYKKQNKTLEIANTRTKTVSGAGLNHGDRLFMFPKSQNLFQSSDTSSQNDFKVPSVVIEDEIDQELHKMDGKVKRPSEERQKCQSWVPDFYDPFDEEYLSKQKIKFMSFHSHIRKLSAGMSKGKFTPLSNISCKKQPTPRCERVCWEGKGICSKCQPSAITLNRQPWRHVDTITFENSHIVKRFQEHDHKQVFMVTTMVTIYRRAPGTT